MFNTVASIDVVEHLRPKSSGKPVNQHVIPAAREPDPDYEAMREFVTRPAIQRSEENERPAKPEPA